MATYVYRTPGSTFTGEKFTFSGWFKRGDLSARNCMLWASSDGGSGDFTEIEFKADGTLHWGNKPSGGTNMQLVTNRVFRDPAAWYHLVFTWDTTLSAGDRAKIYVNGVEETSFSTDSNAGSGETGCSLATSGVEVDIGKQTGSTNYYYGEMSHLHLCIGYAYAASDFGSFDSTSGIWKIKTGPSVTYGTNGWFLKMEDRTNLDLDSSPNAYTFTTSGTLTATYDNPSNNFATVGPLDNYLTQATFSNGNNTVATVSGKYAPNLSTFGMSAGKWYWEVKAVSRAGANDYMIGISSKQTTNTTHELGQAPNDYAYYALAGDLWYNNGGVSYGNSYDTGDIVGVALDLDNNNLYFSKNGTFQDSGDPTSGATGTGAISIGAPASTPLGAYFAGQTYWAAAVGSLSYNFGNGYFGTTAVSSANADDAGIGSFEYDVPTGYYALCTKNIKAYGG